MHHLCRVRCSKPRRLVSISPGARNNRRELGNIRLRRLRLLARRPPGDFQPDPESGNPSRWRKTGSGFGVRESVRHAVIVAAGRARQMAVPLVVAGVGHPVVTLDARRENPVRRRVPSGLRRRNAGRGKQEMLQPVRRRHYQPYLTPHRWVVLHRFGVQHFAALER